MITNPKDGRHITNRPSNQEIRTVLAGRAIVGNSADLLIEKFSASFDKIEARGGITAISNDIAARIEAARKRLNTDPMRTT